MYIPNASVLLVGQFDYGNQTQKENYEHGECILIAY